MVQVVQVAVKRGGRLIPREPIFVDERTHQPMTAARSEAEALFGSDTGKASVPVSQGHEVQSGETFAHTRCSSKK